MCSCVCVVCVMCVYFNFALHGELVSSGLWMIPPDDGTMSTTTPMGKICSYVCERRLERRIEYM